MPKRRTEAEKAKHREYAKVYRARHPDRRRETARKYRDANRALVRKWGREYQARKRSIKAALATYSRPIHELTAAALAAVPASYPAHVRDDVSSMIVLAVLEGQFTVEDIPTKGKAFVTAYWRDRDLYGTLSLDAPIPGCDGVTYIDRLTNC